MEILCLLVIFALFAYGLWRIVSALLRHDRYLGGKRSLQQMGKWYRESKELWDDPRLSALVDFLARFVYLDEASRDSMARKLQRAGMAVSPEQFSARSYLICGLSALAILLCALLQFWLGVLLCGLIALYGLLRQREVLTSRIKERDAAISMEMPRFVRTLCRSLRSNRDIYAALASYRKVAGPILGEELDILLAHMRTGGMAIALQQFQKRLGSDAAFRLCSTLREIDRGIDQSGTLEYLADDMARQSKLNIQKALSTRPGRMRLTYLPAVGVCVAMVLYVLVVFTVAQLNNLF